MTSTDERNAKIDGAWDHYTAKRAIRSEDSDYGQRKRDFEWAFIAGWDALEAANEAEARHTHETPR